MTSTSPHGSTFESTDTVRGAPWSNEAEQAVLGAMLQDQDAALRAVELLDDALFYPEGHRRLFRAMRRLIERRVVIDHVTLRDELERRNELEAAGGEIYLAELIDSAVTAANLEAHAAIVGEKAALRQLIETSTAIVAQAYEGIQPANELPAEEQKRRQRLDELERTLTEHRARLQKAELDSRALDKAVRGAPGDATAARRALATAVALEWLDRHAAAERLEWELLARKATAWLSASRTEPAAGQGWNAWLDVARRLL